MVAAALSMVVLAGVISIFLLIGRSSANISNYADLETQARRALELFGREVRMANSIDPAVFSPTQIRLGIPATPTVPGYIVTYAFDLAHETFTRTDSVTGTTVALIRGVQPFSGVDCLRYYRYISATYAYDYANTNPNLIDMHGATPGNPTEVKQIEITFIARRSTTTVATATNRIISGRFILRNK